MRQRHGVPTSYLIACLEVCVGAHAEGELSLADNRVLVFAEVVAEPEHEIRVERRVNVEVHAEELEFVLFDVGIRIVVFEAYAQGELFRDVEARFNREEHLVIREKLRSCFVVLVGNGIEVVEPQVEDAVVHARFHEEGVDSVALVRVQTVNRVDAVVEHFEALGVVEFGTERVSVAAANFRTEYPIDARGDGQVFVRAVQKLEGVAAKDGYRALAVVGRANVELAFAELGVAEFHAKTADAFALGDDCVAVRVAPEVVIECARVISNVAKNKAYVLEWIPTQFHAVEFESRVAVVPIGDGGRTCHAVADFCGAFGVRDVAARVCKNSNGYVFVEVGRDGQIDVLVCGVSGVKIPVEIAGVVEIDISVDFDVCGCGKTGSGKGNRQNEFTHTILPKKGLFGFYVQKIEISLRLDQCFVSISLKIGIC